MALSFLIVDDSSAMRVFIRKVIGLTGLEVGECCEAGNGETENAGAGSTGICVEAFSAGGSPRRSGEDSGGNPWPNTILTDYWKRVCPWCWRRCSSFLYVWLCRHEQQDQSAHCG